MCKLCEIKPVYQFTNKRKVCKNCFIQYFQKKVLYTIRKFKLANHSDIIGYKDNRTFQDVVLEDVLKIFSTKSRAEIIKLPSKKKTNKIAISNTLDFEAEKIVHTLVKEDISKLKDVASIQKIKNKVYIKPLYLFLDEEVLLYAKLKNLKFKKISSKKDKLTLFVEDLEKKHPEIKRAILNYYLELYS